MKRKFARLVVPTAVAILLMAGCAQAAPAPTPTRAPAAPTAAAQPTTAPVEPTKPVAAQPTAVPVKKVAWPEKGKTITLILPSSAGGTADISARVLAAYMEKDLGTSVQVVNRTGGGVQVGTTEAALAKPDGYTLGYTILPSAILVYLDPERKATFARKDFQPLANQYVAPVAISVQTNSPYKTLKDLIDAAKASPEKIKAGTTGFMSVTHMAVIQLEKAANVRFATVHFQGDAPSTTALLGGHIDVVFNILPMAVQNTENGQFRPLGIMDKEESKFLSGVKTLEAQGYKIYSPSAGGVSAPAGTPKEIVDILSGSMKKAMDTEEHRKKMDELRVPAAFMDPAQYAKFWADLEAETKLLMELATQ